MTRLDVVTRALRRIGVAAEDEAPTADQIANAGAVLDSLFAELQGEATITWTLETTPAVSFVPLANLLAVEMAPEYGQPAPEGRPRAWRRLMATIRSDEREDVRDLDEDGLISDDEADAGARAAYY